MAQRTTPRASPALKRAQGAEGDARSARNSENTVDLSLSDLSPYDYEAAMRKWRRELSALVLGTLLAALGIGWFASSKASEPSALSPAKRAVAPVAAPAASADQASAQLGASALAAVAPVDAPPVAVAQPSGEAPPSQALAAAPSAAGASEPEAQGATGAARAGELVDQAQALLQRKKYAPAKLRFREALQVQPDYPPALSGLVQLAIRQHDGKQAVSLAKQLASANPEEVSYLVLLGDAYKSAHKRKEARDSWRAASRKGSAEARARLKH